jgi:hypothetical protein
MCCCVLGRSIGSFVFLCDIINATYFYYHDLTLCIFHAFIWNLAEHIVNLTVANGFGRSLHSDRDSEDEFDDDIADFEDRKVRHVNCFPLLLKHRMCFFCYLIYVVLTIWVITDANLFHYK